MKENHIGYGGLHDQPIIVELVGPAGSGKTTLAEMLSLTTEKVSLQSQPYFRRFQDIPFFIKNTLTMLPLILDFFLLQSENRITSAEIVWMVTLNGWHRRLLRKKKQGYRIILLDQGPIYLLAYFFGVKSFFFEKIRAIKWREQMYQQWSSTIDMVIWLDTDDDILTRRINTRETWHLLKNKAKEESSKFHKEFRTFYSQVFSNLSTNGKGPEIHSIDTGQLSAEETLSLVSSLF